MNRLVVLCLILMTGCTSVKVAYFDDIRRPSKNTLEVYSNPSRIDRPYKEIALITADDEWSLSSKSETDLLDYLKKKAMEIGADAIILHSGEYTSEGGAFMPVGGNLFYVEENKRIVKVIAIVYTD